MQKLSNLYKYFEHGKSVKGPKYIRAEMVNLCLCNNQYLSNYSSNCRGVLKINEQHGKRSWLREKLWGFRRPHIPPTNSTLVGGRLRTSKIFPLFTQACCDVTVAMCIDTSMKHCSLALLAFHSIYLCKT